MAEIPSCQLAERFGHNVTNVPVAESFAGFLLEHVDERFYCSDIAKSRKRLDGNSADRFVRIPQCTYEQFQNARVIEIGKLSYGAVSHAPILTGERGSDIVKSPVLPIKQGLEGEVTHFIVLILDCRGQNRPLRAAFDPAKCNHDREPETGIMLLFQQSSQRFCASLIRQLSDCLYCRNTDIRGVVVESPQNGLEPARFADLAERLHDVYFGFVVYCSDKRFHSPGFTQDTQCTCRGTPNLPCSISKSCYQRADGTTIPDCPKSRARIPADNQALIAQGSYQMLDGRGALGPAQVRCRNAAHIVGIVSKSLDENGQDLRLVVVVPYRAECLHRMCSDSLVIVLCCFDERLHSLRVAKGLPYHAECLYRTRSDCLVIVLCCFDEQLHSLSSQGADRHEACHFLDFTRDITGVAQQRHYHTHVTEFPERANCGTPVVLLIPVIFESSDQGVQRAAVADLTECVVGGPPHKQILVVARRHERFDSRHGQLAHVSQRVRCISPLNAIR
jgi:hypothetical protein